MSDLRREARPINALERPAIYICADYCDLRRLGRDHSGVDGLRLGSSHRGARNPSDQYDSVAQALRNGYGVID